MAMVSRLLRLRNPSTMSPGKWGNISLCFGSHHKEAGEYESLLLQSSQGSLHFAFGASPFQELRSIYQQRDGGGGSWRRSERSSSSSSREQAQGRAAMTWQRDTEFEDIFSVSSTAQNTTQTNSGERTFWRSFLKGTREGEKYFIGKRSGDDSSWNFLKELSTNPSRSNRQDQSSAHASFRKLRDRQSGFDFLSEAIDITAGDSEPREEGEESVLRSDSFKALYESFQKNSLRCEATKESSGLLQSESAEPNALNNFKELTQSSNELRHASPKSASARRQLSYFGSICMGGNMNTLNRGMILHGLCAYSPMQLQCRTFVQLKTKLTVADNSGAKVVECIKVMNKTRLARLGDTIIASVKEVVGRGKVKKGEVVYCVIVRARMPRRRSDGSEVRFDDNAAVIINKQGEPVGTRIMGPVCHELRRRKMVKVLSLAEHVA